MREKSKFAFAMYDADRDGLISSRDLIDFQKDLPENCPLTIEIKKISNNYLDNTIFTRQKKRPNFFDFDYFFAINSESVLINVSMILLQVYFCVAGIQLRASWD